MLLIASWGITWFILIYLAYKIRGNKWEIEKLKEKFKEEK